MSDDHASQKLWGGRFTGSTNALVESFTESISFDRTLWRHDIRGSIAHATMLAEVGVLTKAESALIIDGLNAIGEDIAAGSFEWSIALEDVHMNIESALTERIGDVGKKLHTGRSRNDQVATDVRLYLRDETDTVLELITELQKAVVAVAAREFDTIMPGFTHMQPAQPVTFGHHMMAWNQMLERDHGRFSECRERIDVMPLGAAALAGTSFPIDRTLTAKLLGFETIASNSMDAVADRDFIIEFTFCAALTMSHLSRFCEELILWSSPQFSFVELADEFCTGSSIMPQKKNPDVAEIVRGKTGRVTGHLTGLLVLMKGQPLTFNRDNQEDKEALFDTVHTLKSCLEVFVGMLPGMEVKRDNTRASAHRGFATATDLADYLVRKGIPFRDAHEIVGRAVKHGIEIETDLSDMSMTTLKGFSALIEDDVYDVLTLEGSVSARNHFGGTAPAQVQRAVASASKVLQSR
jgi:argininosuccinate lyase